MRDPLPCPHCGMDVLEILPVDGPPFYAQPCGHRIEVVTARAWGGQYERVIRLEKP